MSVIWSVITLALLTIVVIRHWRGTSPTSGKRSLFFAAGLLPIATLYFTDQTLFYSMQKKDFCASCHVMEPFVQSLREPDTEHLAGLHVQHGWIRENPCFICHTDYDMMGGARAKVKGLRHLYAFYTKDSKERPSLYNPYPNGNCLSCHKQTVTFDDIEDHIDNMEDILSDDASCMDCHESAHPQ